MPAIRLLPPQVAELIAAGEVVERPASIVKELLENSIDAHATAITVELKEGGVRYLRVTDNGCGIEEADVPAAFLRHATSKLKHREDLETIATLGFRGEALASVAAVAKVELLSKSVGAQLGVKAEVQGGGKVSCQPAGCPEGTTLIVRDLFYNVPARLKFLKKASTEGAYCTDVMEKLALSHPEISFRLIRDNKPVLHTPGDGTLLSAVYAVLGREFASHVRPVDYSYENVSLRGLISSPNYTRANRKLQYFFVNRRTVKSSLCMQALSEGYKNEIMIGRFPACVLEITLPFSSVDVNVHPSKTEVKFLRESSVYECVYFGVKSALSAVDELKEPPAKKPLSTHKPLPEAFQLSLREAYTVRSPAPSFSVPSKPTFGAQVETTFPKPSPQTPAPREKAPSAPVPEKKPASARPDLHRAVQGFSLLSQANFDAPEPPAPAAREPEIPVRYLGEAFQTYLLLEAGDKLILMDKHAAHERIRYEALRKKLSLDSAQALVSPIALTLTPDQLDLLFSHQEELMEYGLRFAKTKSGGASLVAAPSVLEHGELSLLVEEMLSSLAAGKQDIAPQAWERLLETVACRGAIKGGEENSRAELERLALQVWRDPTLRHCPHGRPIALVLSKSRLDKRFGRTGGQGLVGEDDLL